MNSFLTLIPRFLHFLHDHVSHYFKHKLNPNRYDFSKAKFNLVPSLDFISPLVISESQVDFIYCNTSSMFGLVSRNTLHAKLMLSDGCLNCLRVYFIIGTLPYIFQITFLYILFLWRPHRDLYTDYRTL